MKLCNQSKCTACGLCKALCNKNAISFKKDDVAAAHPHIDTEKCVNCGLCMQHCPALNKFNKNSIQSVYAAWSNNDNVRRTSASGGIATELYKNALLHGWTAFGVVFEPDNGAAYVKLTADNLGDVKNSKYTFSSDTIPFEDIADAMKFGMVLFIGLPCQVSAVKAYVLSKHLNDSMLCTVDIICHGVPPAEYFMQHLTVIGNDRSADRVLFRDPKKGTKNYFLSVYRKNRRIYSKSVNMDDTYQLGYHKALIYRENCYSCDYACEDRVGDITLGDFTGLGKIEPFFEDRDNVNCVLVNTDRGQRLFEQLLKENRIVVRNRPKDEAVRYERQLTAPSSPHPKREMFLKIYKENQNFEEAAAIALRDDINKYRHDKRTGKIFLNSLMLKIITPKMRRKLKELLKR